MIHKACMPVYIVIQIFLAHGWTDIQPGVVQEVLADLKRAKISIFGPKILFFGGIFPQRNGGVTPSPPLD